MKKLRNFIQEHLNHNEDFYVPKNNDSFLTFEEFVNKSNIILTNENSVDMWSLYFNMKYNELCTSFILEQNIYYDSYDAYQCYIYNNLFENLNDLSKDIKNVNGVIYSRMLNDHNFTLCVSVNSIYDKDSFEKLLNKHKAFISKTVDGIPYNHIYVEDNDLENVYDEIMSKYNGVLYHITSKENADKILKYGLEPKSIKKKTWHPERIYFLNGNSSSENIKRLGQELSNYWESHKMAILKIDLHKMNNNICFFKDKHVIDTDAYFTQEPIPPYCIEEIYLNTFNKSKEKIFGLPKKLSKIFDKIIHK